MCARMRVAREYESLTPCSQAWPITCTAGTICGHNIGLLSAAVYLFLQARAAEMKSGPGKGGGVGGGVGSGSNRGRSPRRKKD